MRQRQQHAQMGNILSDAWEGVKAKVAAANKATTADLGAQTLKKGMQGPPVRALQLLLVRNGVNAPQTGVFDAATETAVRVFQRKAFPGQQREWDGKVGPKTKAALGGRAPVAARATTSRVQYKPAATPRRSAGASAMPGLPPMKKSGVPGWVWLAGAGGAVILLLLLMKPKRREQARQLAGRARDVGRRAYDSGRERVQRYRTRQLPPPESF